MNVVMEVTQSMKQEAYHFSRKRFIIVHMYHYRGEMTTPKTLATTAKIISRCHNCQQSNVKKN